MLHAEKLGKEFELRSYMYCFQPISPAKFCALSPFRLLNALSLVLFITYVVDIVMDQQASAKPCITHIMIDAKTGNMISAGFSSLIKTHKILLQLYDGTKLSAHLHKSAFISSRYVLELNFRNSFGSVRCITPNDIHEVHLIAGTTDGWYI